MSEKIKAALQHLRAALRVEHIDPALPWAMQAARVVVGMRRKWQRFDGTGLMKAPEARP